MRNRPAEYKSRDSDDGHCSAWKTRESYHQGISRQDLLRIQEAGTFAEVLVSWDTPTRDGTVREYVGTERLHSSSASGSLSSGALKEASNHFHRNRKQ